jgi:ABC-type dipeptide/oligopeptide/nickel transport system permease subunit
MTAATPLPIAAADRPLGHRRWRRFLRERLALAAAAYLLVLLAVALLADVIFTTDPTDTNPRDRFQGPFASGHVLGTDDLGRDLFARVVFSARVSLAAGAGSVAAALVVAVPVGLFAGSVGGRLESAVMRVVDLLLSIPPLILVFAVAGVLGASLRNAIVALAIYFTPLFVRLVVGEVRRLRDGQLVEAARAVGSSSTFIAFRHVLPNIASPLIVQASLSVGVAIIAEASLGFLGLGVRPPTPSWGTMLRGAFDTVERSTWGVFIPTVAMALTVLAFNMLGDGLRRSIGRLDR